ncbi:hypothetical protein F4808DRAFT_470357 [Astrocystis sublimbata]|nr:hypothetical protein F4808DRAFT_470357 [Astrocystis sublimbata]
MWRANLNRSGTCPPMGARNGTLSTKSDNGLVGSFQGRFRERRDRRQTGHSQEENQLGLSRGEASGYQHDLHQPGQATDSGSVFSRLQLAMKSTEVDVLGRYQATSAHFLGKLMQVLKSDTDSADNARLLSIQNLQERTEIPATTIGVVGATGHGKSSLINALLGEKKLVPTNCFRACTSVVTELSWNSSENPDHKYVAEVEFISEDDWLRELQYIFSDLDQSSEDKSLETKLQEPEVAIAWAKIQAVYPNLTHDDLEDTSVEELAAHYAVEPLLGTTMTIQKPTANKLHKALKLYIESRKKMSFAQSASERIDGEDGDVEENGEEEEEGGNEGDDSHANHSDEDDSGEEETTYDMDLWPLIKVVRIRSKADVLTTGAVIVDLPGGQDSNAARASVAGKYIEKCDALFVVSMATRAVDDLAAQRLLGTRFKQQLKLDGNYSNVTFVCSKTDDINVDEAADALGLAEDASKLNNAIRRLHALRSSSELEKISGRWNAIQKYVDEVDSHIDRYDRCRTQQLRGKTVTPPKVTPTKRKMGAHLPRASRRRKLKNSADEGQEDAEWVSAEDHWRDLEKDMPDFPADHHLTQQDIQRMTDYLRSKKSAAANEKITLGDKIDDEQTRLYDLEEEVETLKERLHVGCIARRNECSKRAIREQFSLGLKELDQHEADNTNENSDRVEGLRDYEQVATALPVFCVSSRAYQKLCSKEVADGFNDVDDTDIPQLRIHVRRLTEAIRFRNAKSFLNDLSQTLGSLYLWSSKKSTEFYLSDEDKKAEMKWVNIQVEQLRKRLTIANEGLNHQLTNDMNAIFKCFQGAAIHAAGCASAIAHKWPTNKRGDGGLPCGSYRATLRRHGVFTPKAGPQDFNQDLVAPFLLRISNAWETIFTKKIPDALEIHAKACQEHQENIQGIIMSRLQERAAFHDIMNMLHDLDIARSSGFGTKITSLVSDIAKTQRSANRNFSSAIQEYLRPKYEECGQDKGRGVFARIKLEMNAEIGENSRAMLMSCYKPAKVKLSKMPRDIHEDLKLHTEVMLDGMVDDYRNIILDVKCSEKSTLVRAAVFDILSEVDEVFK